MQIQSSAKDSDWKSPVEYHDLISKAHKCVQEHNYNTSPFALFSSNTHPLEIYLNPKRKIYGLVTKSPGLIDFCAKFSSKGRFSWKKESLTVNYLPQSDPMIGCFSAIATDKANGMVEFMMRMVWRCQDDTLENRGNLMVVLCHLIPFRGLQVNAICNEKQNRPKRSLISGHELDDYLMMLGQQINQKIKEASRQAKEKEEQKIKVAAEEKFSSMIEQINEYQSQRSTLFSFKSSLLANSSQEKKPVLEKAAFAKPAPPNASNAEEKLIVKDKPIKASFTFQTNHLEENGVHLRKRRPEVTSLINRGPPVTLRPQSLHQLPDVSSKEVSQTTKPPPAAKQSPLPTAPQASTPQPGILKQTDLEYRTTVGQAVTANHHSVVRQASNCLASRKGIQDFREWIEYQAQYVRFKKLAFLT